MTFIFNRLEKSGTLKDEDIPKPPTDPTQNPSGILTEWLLTRHSSLPDYTVVQTSGPSHSKTYFMTCKLGTRVTEGRVYHHLKFYSQHFYSLTFVSGEGKSKKAAKNVAAEKMLQIVRDEDYFY